MDRASAIDEFLDSHQDADDRIIGYIRDTWCSLLDDYDYATIYNVENACTLQMVSEDEEKYKKAISRLTKHQIFEIASTVAYLAGMCECYAKLKGGKQT